MLFRASLVFVGTAVFAAPGGPEVRIAAAGEKLAGMAAREAIRQTRHDQRSASADRRVTVFTGDVVIPQVVDGAGWQTSMTFVNMKSTTAKFNVWLFTDDGGDMVADFVGIGKSDNVTVTLPPNNSITLTTLGTAGSLNQGWAYLYTEDATFEVGTLSVFRQRVTGRPDFEAVVPTVSEFDDRFLLTFDNAQGFVTAAAIANSDVSPITVSATVRDEDGKTLVQQSFTIGGMSKIAFTLPSRWPATANKKGVVEFNSTGWGASAIGLRFNPGGAFTSFHVLSNVKWII